MKDNNCTKCGSSNVMADSDFNELLDTNGQLINTEEYHWWHCKDCGNNWRYQDEQLNPGGKRTKP